MRELLRPLGFVERLFEEGNTKFGSWLMIRAVRLSGPSDVEELRAAAERATRSLPLLTSSIVWHRNKPKFARLEKFQPIVESVVRNSSEHWREEIELQLTRRLEKNGPQWRMVVVRSASTTDWELLLVYNHAVADPVSATVHLERILQEFQKPTDAETIKQELTQPLELLLHKENKLRNSLLFIVNQIQLKRQWKTMARFKHSQETEDNPAARKTCVRFIPLQSAQTATLLKTAKQQGVSVQGLLLAAMIRTSNELLQDENAPCLTLSNFSLREECRPEDLSPESGCFFFWCINQIPGSASNNLLSLAQTCSEKVRASFPVARPPAPFFGSFIAKWLQKLVTGDNEGRLATVGVSDIGPISLPEQIGELTIGEEYSLSSQNVVGPEVMLFASTHAGRLYLTLCFVAPLLSPEQMNDFRDHFITELISFV